MDDASPRFRQDLEASATEAEGVACVDVRDPQTGTSFRFYDFEYQLALQCNGQPLRDVVAWASEAYGVDLTVDGINEFAGRLSELGFLETGGVASIAPDATPAVGIKVPIGGLDNAQEAEDEWMSNEGSKTATFVPDPGMLDGPSELTPVAPSLPMMDMDDDAGAAPAKPADAPTPPPRLFDIPSPAAAAAPPKPASPASEATTSAAQPAEPGGKPAFSWAVDLDDKLPGAGEARPGATTEPAPAPTNGSALTAATTGDRTPPPVGLPTPAKQTKLPTPPTSVAAPPRAGATPVPPGLPERRQPPAPDAVQMGAFSPEAAAAKPKSGAGRVVAVVILLLVVAAAVAYFAISRENARVPPAAMRVRVLSPKPSAVYRWFSGRGTVTDHEARLLAFDSSGTLAELLPPGTSFAAGDILGRLRGAAPVEALLSRQRARLAFYEQMRASMRAANNRPELRQAELRLVEKQRLIDETNASLAKLVVRAGEPGEVVETLAKVGMPVRPSAPVVRVKGRMLHGTFELDADEIAIASKLGFCRVEVVGLGPRASNSPEPAAPGTAADVGSPDAQAVPRFVDCTIETSGASGGKQLRVALPDNLGLVPGQPLRLARQRYDAVFPVPAAAVGGADGQRTVWVANPAGTAERRDVVVADLSDDALISEGLRVGDEVILDAPAGLQPGAPVTVDR